MTKGRPELQWTLAVLPMIRDLFTFCLLKLSGEGCKGFQKIGGKICTYLLPDPTSS